MDDGKNFIMAIFKIVFSEKNDVLKIFPDITGINLAGKKLK
jgi:hypothetical protein